MNGEAMLERLLRQADRAIRRGMQNEEAESMSRPVHRQQGNAGTRGDMASRLLVEISATRRRRVAAEAQVRSAQGRLNQAYANQQNAMRMSEGRVNDPTVINAGREVTAAQSALNDAQMALAEATRLNQEALASMARFRQSGGSVI